MITTNVRRPPEKPKQFPKHVYTFPESGILRHVSGMSVSVYTCFGNFLDFPESDILLHVSGMAGSVYTCFGNCLGFSGGRRTFLVVTQNVLGVERANGS